MPRVALLTSDEFPDLAPEDQCMIPVLRARGVDAEALVWTRATVDDASRYDALVFRSCWDYSLHAAAFFAWLDALEARGVRTVNAVAAIRWNADKRYLVPLASAIAGAIPVDLPTTAFVPRGDAPPSLAALLEAHAMDEAVVKPTVSGGGRDTFRTSRAGARAGVGGDEARYRQLVAREDVMVQAFVPEIATRGEVSLLVFGGKFSHAVEKRARAGEFRIQEAHGGVHAAYAAGAELARFAEEVVAGAERITGTSIAYGRVDVVLREGAPALMELEIIEPSLWLALDPGAPVRYGDAIVAALARA